MKTEVKETFVFGRKSKTSRLLVSDVYGIQTHLADDLTVRLKVKPVPLDQPCLLFFSINDNELYSLF